MGRYCGPVCRLCRQVGEKLFLKGDRCYTPKCPVEKRRSSPGQVTRGMGRRRLSDYAVRLREKQKLRYSYGLMEQQMRRYMEAAQKQPGITGQYLLQLLERRLDNVMYRLNFAASRKQGRQLVLHGHIAVNWHKVDIPSFIVKPDDVVTWTEGSKEDEFVQSLVADGAKRPLTSWLNLDSKNLTGHVLSMPQPEDLDTKLNTRLIVEFYSR